MDAWWPKLALAIVPPALGPDATKALEGLLGPGDLLGGEGYGPEWDIGWYSYVQKDLRDVFTPRSVRGRFSRRLCGGGRQFLRGDFD